MNEYKLIDYYDVWGNEEYGYEVNNLCDTGYDITISDDATDEDIIFYLRQIKYLSSEANVDSITLEWNDDFVCEIFQTEDMLPLGRLERKVN